MSDAFPQRNRLDVTTPPFQPGTGDGLPHDLGQGPSLPASGDVRSVMFWVAEDNSALIAETHAAIIQQ